MAKGNKPYTSEYKQTANNTKAYNHGNDIQYGASGGESEEQDTGRQEMAGAPTFQAGRRSDKQQETMDLTKAQLSKPHHHQKKSKVIPSRRDFNASVQQHDVSSATQTVQDIEQDGGIYRTTKVFSYGTDGVDDVDTDTPDNAQLYYNFEPVNGPITQDTDDQLNGAVCTEDVIIAEETQSPQEQERSDELVCEKKDTSCLTNILPSSNYEDALKSMCLKERQHKERLTMTEECRFCKDDFHATEKHDFLSHQAEGGKVLEQSKQKVGLVRCQNCGDLGTCFRIGKYNIATCWHVNSKCTGADHPITAVFYHQGPNQQDTWVYTMREKNVDIKLDYAIYQLCSNGKSFPPAFTKFRDSTHADGSSEGLVYLICFQKDATDQSKLGVDCDTVRLNSNTLDDDRLYNCNLRAMEKYTNNTSKSLPYGCTDFHRDNGHVPLLCKITHGGSGGVGVFFDGNGDVVVDFMYRRGYPGFFYKRNPKTALTTDEKEKFPGCLLMEVGLDIRMMMKKSGQGLWECGE